MTRLIHLALAAILIAGSMRAVSAADAPIKIDGADFVVVDGVNVRNGNYAVTFTKFGDADDAAKAAFAITYNSMSDHAGWFGRGWGSTLEHKVVHLQDNTLLVRYIGTAAVYLYTPNFYDGYVARKTAALMANRIVKDDRLSKKKREGIESRLLDDPSYRFEMALKHNLSAPPTDYDGKLEVDAASGFASDKCPGATFMMEARAAYLIDCDIGRLPASYTQKPDAEDNRHPVVFNASGDLKETFNSYFGRLIVAYDHGKAEKLYGQKHVITIKWGRFGIVSMTDETGEEATFAYDNKGRLTENTQYSGASYHYKYDKAGRLTAIGYIDGSTTLIAYDDSGRAISVTQRNGDTTHFVYQVDPTNPKRCSTRVIKYAASGTHAEQMFEFQN